ncbi:MAG: MarR family transcriptional regulator [Thiothrix sp.]|nr:MAG: MarR family transcriptional regulator [Thiothrix sp.]
MIKPTKESLSTERLAATKVCVQLTRLYAENLRRMDSKLSSIHGLSFSDFTILYHLSQAPLSRLRRSELAELMGLTASAVTRSLLPLEKIGLIERQSDQRDARIAYASLTPSGEHVFKEATITAELACQDALQTIPASLTVLLKQV